MSDERGCLGQAFRIGYGCTLILMLVAAGLAIYAWMARSPAAPELTLLVQQYLDEQGIEGGISVTLPGDDLELSFRTLLEQLERFMNLDPLPSWVGSDVPGVFRVHLMVVDNEPFAELEGASLYGIPVPMSLLGAAAQGNWFERLDADSTSAIRGIRSPEIRDATLFISID